MSAQTTKNTQRNHRTLRGIGLNHNQTVLRGLYINHSQTVLRDMR